MFQSMSLKFSSIFLFNVFMNESNIHVNAHTHTHTDTHIHTHKHTHMHTHRHTHTQKAYTLIV